jgi:alpha-L-fucosidase
MSISRRQFLQQAAVTAATVTMFDMAAMQGNAKPLKNKPLEIEGPFKPAWDSLLNYEAPEWFRNSKFGIWAHWTAQCVPEQGDWYARMMYIQGTGDYDYQCAHYGHPSKVGFKDIDHIWHAEKWEPEKLIEMYKAAGARYFVALANHHDNFDCFSSDYQPWNSTKIGPKKDIVGTWAKYARKAGMRFGVTVHAARTWYWFDVAQGSDKTGPLAGVPYDGKLTKADGKGQWWEGLDPQDLYAQNHAPDEDLNPASGGDVQAKKAYIQKFYNRVLDLIDKYNPDLLYFDDGVLPLNGASDIGLNIAAYYYNNSIKRHGVNQAVLNCKDLNDMQRKCMVRDIERGRSEKIDPSPWQTDTCIGNWHYDIALYENHRYKTAHQVTRMLMDIISKNGNLLLNIPLPGNGQPDPDELNFLKEMTAWISINSEAIYDTRPWKISGEGIVHAGSDSGNDGMTEKDFRFTTKGGALYATAMGWPQSGVLTLRTLASNAQGIVGDVSTVRLLGVKKSLQFKRTDQGLEVTLPEEKPCEHAWILKIEGLDLAKSEPVPPPPMPVHPSADGSLVLNTDTCVLHGSKIQIQSGTLMNIGYWDNADEYVSWNVDFPDSGTYAVTMQVAAANGDTSVTLNAGSDDTTVNIPKTENWDNFVSVNCSLSVSSKGEHVLTVKPADSATWRAMNLATVTLKKLN